MLVWSYTIDNERKNYMMLVVDGHQNILEEKLTTGSLDNQKKNTIKTTEKKQNIATKSLAEQFGELLPQEQ